MEKKVIGKILHYSYYKRIVKDFDEWFKDKVAMQSLRSMKDTEYPVIDIVKEVWEEIKSKD